MSSTEGNVEKQVINPWSWQDRFGFVQANKVTGADVDAYRQAAPAVGARLGQAGVKQAASLIGVARLALPELLVEIEATAAK
jgi:enamine deaminase RidA (YjgF/YER057c/UK114 family)